jgi:hypothetical protein
MQFRGNYKFCVGNSPTYPDFYAYEFMAKAQILDPEFWEVVPGLREYFDAIEALDNMATYAEKANRELFHLHNSKWTGKVTNE